MLTHGALVSYLNQHGGEWIMVTITESLLGFELYFKSVKMFHEIIAVFHMILDVEWVKNNNWHFLLLGTHQIPSW